MLYVGATRFNVTGNFEKFWELNISAATRPKHFTARPRPIWAMWCSDVTLPEAQPVVVKNFQDFLSLN